MADPGSLEVCNCCQKILSSSYALEVDDIMTNESNNGLKGCPCCLGAFNREAVVAASKAVLERVRELGFISNQLLVRVDVPDVVNLSRNIARVLWDQTLEKQGSSCTVGQGLALLIASLLQGEHGGTVISELDDQNSRDALVVAHTRFTCSDAGAKGEEGSPDVDALSVSFRDAVRPSFRPRRGRQTKFGLSGSSNQQSLSKGDLAHLYDRIRDDLKGHPDFTSAPWQSLLKAMRDWSVSMGAECKFPTATYVTVTTDTFYVYGRYTKHARDVPQAEWFLGGGEGGGGKSGTSAATRTSDQHSGKRKREGSDHDHDQGGGVGGGGNALLSQFQSTPNNPAAAGVSRKGRNSVQEIIAEAVTRVTGARKVSLHACGREDIDVRCLGNGRPFVLKVEGAQRWGTAAHLATVSTAINRGEGLNGNLDVQVTHVQGCSHQVWTNMQTVAEEKCKSYTCLVVCSQAPSIPANSAALAGLLVGSLSGSNTAPHAVTNTDLAALEGYGTRDVDPDGHPCLRVDQKTPLRVLHRRSLMNRPKYLYNLRTQRLTSNAFLLHLTTTAGAYVKEFVHGDWGRTQPNVSSILRCQAAIIQLDVARLHDDLPGNGSDSN